MFIWVLILAHWLAPVGATTPTDSKIVTGVRAKGIDIPHDVFALTAMPGERMDLQMMPAPSFAFRLIAHDGAFEVGSTGWVWTAPATPGLYSITLADEVAGRSIQLNVFVLRPFDHASEVLNGFQVGKYEEKPLSDNPVYQRPAGFIEVTPEMLDVQLSPHFKLGQFLCKQEGGWPKYLALREPILLKLEMLLEAVRQRGVQAESLNIMSGFRTPYYNRLIGNRTRYSRHLYGGAVDVFVDVDGDGQMDDLTGDGRSDRSDAVLLADIVNSLSADPRYGTLVGGLGVYGPKSSRGPFVHMDVRQKRTRW